MKQTHVMNRATAAELGDALLAAAGDIATRYGLEVEAAAGSFSTTEFKGSVRFKLPATNPRVAEKLAADFADLHLNPAIVGCQMTVRRHTYTVTGVKPYAKYCIVTRRDDGKTFMFPYATAEKHFPTMVTRP